MKSGTHNIKESREIRYLLKVFIKLHSKVSTYVMIEGQLKIKKLQYYRKN